MRLGLPTTRIVFFLSLHMSAAFCDKVNASMLPLSVHRQDDAETNVSYSIVASCVKHYVVQFRRKNGVCAVFSTLV